MIPDWIRTRFAWLLALLGQGLFVFAAMALSGPGRIDIVDGQTRFEVGRSLSERGDSVMRDPRIEWAVFPGRDGLNYTTYRIPQSLLAVGAIRVADRTGPVREGRRHFFFVLTSAFAGAILGIVYTLGFSSMGMSPLAAMFWGLGGIFCTPNWFYATSTFDDILTAATVVAGCVVARATRNRRAFLGAAASGLLMGLAYHCKQPTGAFVLVVLAMHDDRSADKRQRLLRGAIIVLGLALGVVTEKLYDYAKYPFDKQVVHAELLAQYAPVYAFQPFSALACFALSPSCGIFWYCPPVVLGLCGIARLLRQGERTLVRAVLLTSITFIGFHCFISFFKGDPAWGPRYLTPWFAMLWLFAPLGASSLTRGSVAILLALGVVVQLSALAVDPHRLYAERGVTASFALDRPLLYFYPSIAHLWQRPREIVEIIEDTGSAAEYTPAPAPTFAFPLLGGRDLPEMGHPVVERYGVLRSFRPWWSSQRMLPETERPVPMRAMLWGLSGMAGLGGLCLVLGHRFLSTRQGKIEGDPKTNPVKPFRG